MISNAELPTLNTQVLFWRPTQLVCYSLSISNLTSSRPQVELRTRFSVFQLQNLLGKISGASSAISLAATQRLQYSIPKHLYSPVLLKH